MKKNKIITTAIIASLTLNGLPINVLNNEVYAREYADVWQYQVTSDFYYDNSLNIIKDYKGTIVPREFGVAGMNVAHYIRPTNLNNKGIQFVSFVQLPNLRSIGPSSFSNNEIRKIYWNKSSYYKYTFVIESSAFQNNKIQSLDLPVNVSAINEKAFLNNEISYINGWNNITVLGAEAFKNNKLVSSLPNGYKFTLPSKIEIINANTFTNNLLTDIVIPNHIIEIKAGAFSNNPVKTIYFKNQNTIIDRAIVSGVTKDITVYGHGETSTAKAFANYHKATYVNVNELEWYIIDAEESKTQEKLDLAYVKINQMIDSQLKTTYLERLDQVRLSFGVEGYVAKAETSVSFENYYIAKEKVSELKAGYIKTAFETRLVLVLNKLNLQLNQELTNEVNNLKTKEDINIEDLSDLNNKINDMPNGTNKTNLINQMNSLKELANKNTYLLAENATEHAENYPNIKNIIDAKNMIDLLPHGFSLIEDTARSKENLMNRIDSISPKIYMEEAIKKAEKTIKQEDIDNARLLTFYIEDQTERNHYLDRVEAVQNKLNGYDELFKTTNKSIEDYSKFGTDELYNKSVNLINSIDNDLLEQAFLEKLYEANYINKINKIILEAEVYGLSDQTRIELLANMSLINPENPKYDGLITKIKPLIEEFNNYKVDYLQIMKSIQAIDINDVHSLNLENYAKIRSEILTLKRNNVYKEELLSELNKLQLKLTALENGLKGSDIVKNDIDAIEKIENNINDIKNIITNINQFDNEAVRKMLKEELDLQLEKLALENVERNIINSTKITDQTIKTLKEYISNVSNKELKQAIVNEVSEVIHNKVINEINSKGIEKIIKDKFTIFGQDIESLKGLLTKDDNANMTDILDNKISEYILHNYNVSTTINEKVLNELADLYKLIENNQLKEANEQYIEELLSQYFDVNYAGYNNDTLDEGKYKELIAILSKFEDFDFNVFDYNAMVEKNDGILKEKVNDSIKNVTFNNRKEIKELISNIENVKETFLKEELDKKLVGALMERLTEIDLNNKSSLNEIIDIMSTLNSLNSVNEDTKGLINNVLEEYFNNNPVPIANLAKGTAYEEQMNYTLYKYLTEENFTISNIHVVSNPNETLQEYSDERILKELTEIEDKLERMKEVNANLLVLLEKLNSEKGVVSNAYVLPESDKYNTSYSTNSSDYEKIYNDMYNQLKETESNDLIQNKFTDNKELVSVLTQKIEKLNETNNEAIINNMIDSQIEKLLTDSKKLNNKIEQFEKESKNTNKLVIAFGSSLWLLLVIGFGLLLKTNRKNRKKIEKLSIEGEKMKSKMEEMHELNREILEEIKKQKTEK